MANMDIAIDCTLRQEDPNLSGVITNIKNDKGGRTRYGVAERSHHELTSSGFYDTMDSAEALIMAKEVYKLMYGNYMRISDIKLQSIANAALSFAINDGPERAAKLIQEALSLPEDGDIGPQTLSKLNSVSPVTFLQDLQTVAIDYYTRIVHDDPSQSKFLKGWIARAKQNCNTS